MRKYSYHLSSSRLISGSSTAYEEIETMLAGWLGYNACTILNSGYDANLALFNIFKIQIVSCFQIKKIMRVLLTVLS